MREDAKRQRQSLEQTDHRPWPLPDRPWMLAQTWHDLLFAHWAVKPADLRRVVPAELPLDTFEGTAWVGTTPFCVTGFRLLGTPPVPVVSSFPELNVRTYVTIDGKPGIYFLSLDADSRLAVAGARRSHRLPYFQARMSARRVGSQIHYASDRVSADGPAATLRARYGQHGSEFVAPPGSLERWLTERYCLYTLNERRSVLRADIHHRPWKLRVAEATIGRNTMTAGLGIELAGIPLLHLSERQDTLLWGLQPA
jgi:uncharacterized protein YqjF (DUF2071 family)